MIRPGKTPLMRSKKLEKALGVKEIYLKLEGANPFGNKLDRISETLVKDAMINRRGLLIDGPSDYIQSMLNYSESFELEAKIALFKNEQWKRTLFKDIEFVDFRNNTNSSKHELMDNYCKKNNYYNASNIYGNKHLSIISLQKIGEEIAEKLGDISTVFTQLSNGFTVSGIYNGLVNKWVEGEISKYPQIFSCTIPHGNLIFRDYKKNLELDDISIDDFDGVNANKYTKNLFADEGALLEETLYAIYDTDGKVIPVDEDLLKESAHFLRKQENISLTTQEAYSFAGFYKLAKEGKIKDGKHVIVLNNGKSELDIKILKNFKEYPKEDITNWTKQWLQAYSDSFDETEEAVEKAMENGFVVMALRNKIPQGIGVVVNLGFSKVLPTYHLVYIGTKEGNKGRGIASELFGQLIELTEGRLSLHVDLENKRARTLYQKLGFKTQYYRMIYKGD